MDKDFFYRTPSWLVGVCAQGQVERQQCSVAIRPTEELYPDMKLYYILGLGRYSGEHLDGSFCVRQPKIYDRNNGFKGFSTESIYDEFCTYYNEMFVFLPPNFISI
jgi:hypothetical protein